MLIATGAVEIVGAWLIIIYGLTSLDDWSILP